MLCSRCLDLIDVTDANFCSRCGRNLASIRTKTLDAAELHELLPRLAEIRRWLYQCRDEARTVGHAAAVDLVEKRLAFLARIEQRLEQRLHLARETFRKAR